MKSLENIIDGLEANTAYAKDQEEYQTLLAHRFPDGMMCCALELDPEDIEEIQRTGKIYVSMLTFNRPLTPFFVTGDSGLFREYIEEYQG